MSQTLLSSPESKNENLFCNLFKKYNKLLYKKIRFWKSNFKIISFVATNQARNLNLESLI